jgi:putative phosphonate metabolism protein
LPDREDTGRYAIYYVPPAASGLYRNAAQWLGRDVETGSEKPRPAVGDLAWHEIADITASPKHYGFHATLKPPFVLRDGVNEQTFLAAVADVCNTRRPFSLPALRVGTIAGFVALLLSEPCAEMDDLANTCVEALDPFRAPPSPAELEKRRQAQLTPRQEELLEKWGYPYVMEEFRFHMTLTERLPEPDEIRESLDAFFAPHLREPPRVDGIAVCRQDQRSQPFQILARVPFGG